MPGSMLGMLGGGQLGRMFTKAAQCLGYQVTVLDPAPESPAGRVADHFICAYYADHDALLELSTHCVAITKEFEKMSHLQKNLEIVLPILNGIVYVTIMYVIFRTLKKEGKQLQKLEKLYTIGQMVSRLERLFLSILS